MVVCLPCIYNTIKEFREEREGKKWKQNAMKVKKELFNELYIKHEVTFRLYRSWEDFEQYNIQSIRKIKRRIADGATI